MSTLSIDPITTISTVVLPQTGTLLNVSASLPFGIYGTDGAPLYDQTFVSGAVDQVAYTYWSLGGNILDVELTEYNVYAAYEQAVLEYSYQINLHQSRNVLSSLLGEQTGTFDHDGNIKSGSLSASLGGTHVGLKYPKFGIAYTRRVGFGLGQAAGIGGTETEYSASIDAVVDKQDYDLQALIGASPEFSGAIGNKQILITKVFYKSPRAAWRFYGYYGGLTTVGNFHNYGQWADDSAFEIIPVWHNKLQAIQYENAIYTRLSHYSFELKNNKLRLYPPPSSIEPKQIWIRFYIPTDPWEDEGAIDTGVNGINNMNTLPFGNIPYCNINGIGKQWIREYALAVSMETLGYVRSKFSSIPIPGSDVTLNGPELVSKGLEEQKRLRDELKTILDEMVYGQLMAQDADLVENANKIQGSIPMTIFVG
jgi:hypothetical protein